MMDDPLPPSPRPAEVVAPCRDLDAACAAFSRLGFRMLSIFPADAPRVAVLEGEGLRLRLEVDAGAVRPDVELRLAARTGFAHGHRQQIDGGPLLVWQDDDALAPTLGAAPTAPSVCRAADTPWGVGRAGMLYRDLLPHRLGGRIIASHIRIPDGGEVPDLVHYHTVGFQVICCLRGWVEVVYEDQGPPFLLRAGDVVLQPPQIRHRVLRASSGLEVLEVTAPAQHPTQMDHELALPNGQVLVDRTYGGQRFARHVAGDAPWTTVDGGLAIQETAIHRATNGHGGVRLLRAGSASTATLPAHTGPRLLLVTEGSIALDCQGTALALSAGDSVFDPLGTALEGLRPAADLAMVEVTVDTKPGDQNSPMTNASA